MARAHIYLLVIAFLAAFPALARGEPPARVGRISFASGDLASHTPGQNEWSSAGVNYPVATGTSLWTEPDARAEIRIGPNTIAMTGGTELDFGRLTAQITQLNLPQGRIYLHVRQLDDAHTFEIAIPRGGVLLLQPGSYDIDAGSENQPARIAVFDGAARFAGNGSDTEIKPGDVAVLNGFNPVSASIERAVADAFVEWCRSRDYDEKRLAAPYLVSPDMTGYAELDANGRWDAAPGYGQVWYPNVPAGWAPYTDGHWVWIEPWGWTWIDDAPWGFAPSHYGRWAFVGERWCWVPGNFVSSPVYAPALVAFLGGPGVGLYLAGAVGPQIGWFPLAPGEIYWPSYRADASYIRALNRGSVANIDAIAFPRAGRPPVQVTDAQFANRRFAAVVPQHAFASSARVNPSALRVPAGALDHARVLTGSPSIRPARSPALAGLPAFGARGGSGRIAGSANGYGGTVAPMPGAQRDGHGPVSAVQAPASPQIVNRQRSAAVRSGGRWAGAAPSGSHAAAALSIPAAREHGQPAAHPQAGYR
ncbi:MAG: hypothetical protein JO095_15285, partial [Alphaproteobacteria bacterium]|nr:hypothetical protein [Alphaproteobacteria bacterium]